MWQTRKQSAFALGQIVATPGAFAALEKAGQAPGEFLARHVNREWGDLSDVDRKENDYGLEHGFRLLSVYRTRAGDKLWIITESDRSVSSVTTLLLPEEYYIRPNKFLRKRRLEEMNATMLASEVKVAPAVVSSIQDIPLNKIRESANPV
jgi:hypothetical protein